MSASNSCRITMALMAGSLLFSSTAASAQQPASQISPWAALSVFGTQSSKAAVCGASTATTAAAQNDRPGCVLPVVDAPAVPVADGAVVPLAPIPVAGSTGVPPLLLALAVIATGAFLLAMNDDDEDDDIPISPS